MKSKVNQLREFRSSPLDLNGFRVFRILVLRLVSIWLSNCDVGNMNVPFGYNILSSISNQGRKAEHVRFVTEGSQGILTLSCACVDVTDSVEFSLSIMHISEH